MKPPNTGPLAPCPDILTLAGSPILSIDLVTGVIGDGPDFIGGDALLVLRVLAQRHVDKKHASRALLYHNALGAWGDFSRVDDAVAALKQQLGSFAHHVEKHGDDWYLWADPE